jgi:dihydroflavonol-4-reductase
VDAVVHTASPFPMVQPKDSAEVIRPAVDGALRAARAARDAGVGRFVMTSSTVAVMGRPLPPGKAAYDEADWTDGDDPGETPYARSKALAEKAVWDFAGAEAPGMAVTMINPGFIVGPPLDGDYGTSIAVIERLMKGKDPMLPDFGFVCVDVRDVAALHVAALTTPASEGKRVLAIARFMTFVDIARALKAAFPSRRIPTRVAPNFVVRMLALFDKAIAQIVPELGKVHEVSNARAREVFGIGFRDVSASIVETGQAVVKMGRV